jgi:hypothetical protein
MRYRLRTLLIVLALGPLVIAWTLPPAIRAVNDWLWRSEPTQTDFERVVEQLLADTQCRSAMRGGLLHGKLIDDFGEQPRERRSPLSDEPSLADEIDRLFPPEESKVGASDQPGR